jgi:primosomal protein N' (replication factor Y)
MDISLSQTKYADVILPLPLANVFTYSVPVEFEPVLKTGMRVMVPVQKKIYTGIVYSIHLIRPEKYETKDIISLLDQYPIIRRPQMQFWEWISNYYQAFLGDVYKAALPSGLKLESETQVMLRENYEEMETQFTPREWKIVDALKNKHPLSIKELEKNIGVKNALPVLKNLLEKEAVVVAEKVIESYKPKKEDFVRLSEDLRDEDKLKAVFDKLNRSKKQLDLLIFYLNASGAFQKEKTELSKKSLLETAGTSASVLNGLVEKGILELYKKEIGRLNLSVVETHERNPLNPFQQKAYGEILSHYQQKNVVLLHGVTSSGKTEIYIRLIEDTLKLGRQVLYLLPEIALTSQLTTRLKKVFGNKLGVYHSKFPDAERVEIWNNLLHDKGYQVILGVRSSIFLPFKDLGLIIVDEEHENTYKQYDPAPRYHARNAAIVLANLHGGKVLLGTATPSIESYNNALMGKYGLVELSQRYEEIAMPEIIAVDVKELRRKKQMKSMYSPQLLERMQQALADKEQVILFQNRRGYAPYIECPACGYIPKCKNCDVSLTVHKAFHALTCHYCGYTESIPPHCTNCGHESIETKGLGTERVEDEIQELFPEARISRMDLDTTRTKTAYEKIISDFERQKVDILVGTQMISKGLDFEHVSLVGILNADNMLNYPDFRAHERAFQLMAQVSGRAGRKNKQGTVILQTSNVNHPIIRQVIDNDYKAMFTLQMEERKAFKYPPYYRLIYVNVKHRDLQITNKAAHQMAESLRSVFGSVRVLGPDNPPVTRIQNLFLKRIMIKIEAEASNEEAKKLIHEVSMDLLGLDLFKSLQINLDVDPM